MGDPAGRQCFLAVHAALESIDPLPGTCTIAVYDSIILGASRQEANIKRSLKAELYFYSRGSRFEFAEPIEPVPIDKLP